MKHKAKVLARDVDKMTRAEWLEIRRKGIGGSDAAAICGLNPWRGPLAVYLSKIGAAPETKTTEAMEWGTELEDVIAKHFARKTGYKVQRCRYVLQHPDYPWMLANVDRFVKDDEETEWGVLEIKNVGAHMAADWQEGVPDYYNVQVQHYMAVTGLSYAWIAPLIGGTRMQPVKVERSDGLIRSLIKIEREFWERVQKRVPPPIDDSPEATAVLRALYPQSQKVTVEIDPTLYEQLKAAKERLEQAEREVRGLENRIKEIMKDAEAAVIPGNPKPVITWRGSEVRRLDVQRMQEAEPELCAKYLVTSTTRRFLVR